MGPAIAVASIVSSIAAAGMSAYSSMQSAAYNAQVARNNQTIANQNAAMTLQQGTVAEENQRLKTGSMIGAIQSQEAARGVETNKGSALDVRSSAAETGELDAENIRYNANVQAWNLKNQANQSGAQAQLDQSQGMYGMFGSILGGASSVSDKWLKYNKAGIMGGNNVNSYDPTVIAGWQ